MLTAREVLELFCSVHDEEGHSIKSWKDYGERVVFYCSCGAGWKIDSATAAAFQTSLKDVRYGLRNAWRGDVV